MWHQAWTFLRLIWGEWASRVTGSLSAVLLIVGLGISIASAAGVKVPAQSLLQIATWLLVAICGGQAAYAVWARERVARDRAEAELAALRGNTPGNSMPPENTNPLHRAFSARRERDYRQVLGVDARADALQLTFEPTTAFERSQAHADHMIRTWCVCVENIDSSHFITNCKLYVNFGGAEHLLNDVGTLNATERRYIEVATHHEMATDKFIHFHTPPARGGFYGGADYLKLALGGGLCTFRASSAETRSTEVICRLFVDDAGKFRMERV